MDLKTRSLRPWLLPVYLVGLLFVFLGERIFSGTDSARYGFTGLGVVGLLASTVVRFLDSAKLEGDRKLVERRLALFSLGGDVAVALYFTLTETGKKLLGVTNASPQFRARFEGTVLVAMVAILVLSVLPLIFGERALLPMRRAERIESRRVVAATLGGMTLALALVYCALFTYASGELEYKADYSYFRTSRASESTKHIAESLNENVKIQAFFPDLNEVGTEVLGYLREVKSASPRVELEIHDRLMVPQIAKDAKVTQDGVIVLTRGNSKETLTIGAEMKTAAAKLKTIDADFQKALIKVLREAKIAYFTVGHGELNDATNDGSPVGRSGKLIKKLLESQNYIVKDLGLTQGLATEVPPDATTVLVIGPSQPLLPEEVATLKRYADRGGHLFLALDPEAKIDLAPLAAIAGVAWDPVMLSNDKSFLKHDFKPSDHRILVANRFSSHASVSTLSRVSARGGLILPGASSVDKRADAGDLKIDFVVKANTDTFNDINGNFEFDSGGGEKRQAWNLAAAVSHPAPGDGKSKDPAEMRAIVVADADVVSDAAIGNDFNALFAVDALRWLGGEESFSGSITSNEDVRIEHTKQKDEIWFYSTIFGIPGLVLGGGLLFARRKRPTARKPPARRKPTGSGAKAKPTTEPRAVRPGTDAASDDDRDDNGDNDAKDKPQAVRPRATSDATEKLKTEPQAVRPGTDPASDEDRDSDSDNDAEDKGDA